MRHRCTAFALLLLGLFVAFVWTIPNHLWPLDREMVGQVWNASGAVLRIGTFLLLIVAYRTWEMVAVCCLLMTFDLMVAGCSLAFLYSPWVIDPSQEACSQRLHIPLGIVGALIGLLLLLAILRGKKNERHD